MTSREGKFPGNVLLIDINKFHGETFRENAREDREEVKHLWTGLGLQVTDMINPSREEMELGIIRYKNLESHKMSDYLIVFIIDPINKENYRDKICMAEKNETMEVEWIVSQFYTKNSPNLEGKPKLFFFIGIQLTNDEAASSVAFLETDDTTGFKIVREKCDICQIFIIIENSPLLISEFIKLLCEKIREGTDKGEKFSDILNSISRDIRKKKWHIRMQYDSQSLPEFYFRTIGKF